MTERRTVQDCLLTLSRSLYREGAIVNKRNIYRYKCGVTVRPVYALRSGTCSLGLGLAADLDGHDQVNHLDRAEGRQNHGARRGVELKLNIGGVDRLEAIHQIAHVEGNL